MEIKNEDKNIFWEIHSSTLHFQILIFLAKNLHIQTWNYIKNDNGIMTKEFQILSFNSIVILPPFPFKLLTYSYSHTSILFIVLES